MSIVKKVCIVFFLVVSVLNVYKTIQKRLCISSDHMLRNIEALAIEEGNEYICIGEGDLVCPVSKMKVELVYIIKK
ncbi:MAG: hypothetical protein E7097_12380 [Bacteroides sp.]|nr:hypothetical protein [Bacteroides sp.]